MSRDRLGQQKYDNGFQRKELGELEMGNIETKQPETGIIPLNTYYDHIETIDREISTANENIHTIETLHSRTLDAASAEESDANSKQLESVINGTRQLLLGTKEKIKGLERNNLKLGPTSDAQIRRNRHTAIKTKFMETLKRYQYVEIEYKERYKQMLERQYRIVNPTATEEEIQQVLDSDEGGQIFAQGVLNSSRGEAKRVMKSVQDRHEDIVKIEKNIIELANLFQEMQLLVEAQDEQLQTVEQQMNNTVGHTTNANTQIDTAINHAKSARKKRWCILFAVIILIIVIVLIIYFTVIKK
ncbi:hypothetical protein K7432_007760 [Basidiobolus ranarum]|uniref:t-SNARE coiled-coil homology domain-containing protein n=1 Tax=Basidiobolus ranarum TaxID=34480 RepID=A0ABR2WSU2_9FUNG